MSYTNSRWYYFEEEGHYFALIAGALYESLVANDGHLYPEFWRVDVPSLKRGERARMARIAKKLLGLP